MQSERFNSVDMIINCFAVMIRINSIILIIFMFLKDRHALSDEIKKDKDAFQKLFKTATVAITLESCCISIIFSVTDSNYSEMCYEMTDNEFKKMTAATVDLKDLKDLKVKKQAATAYKQFKAHSNVHINLHFKIIATEYTTSNNINVLIEKNKHKYVVY